ncbi:RNA polymerase II transcription mediator complex subunit 9-domain-containing protein [Scheffersomyces coipomensis]|uniref:RNA polymerase II transcription mediator complex subunit 9-domain-containing protein n=1 Tax=Scheffersomyces coipomensis TaxID=1788519 RepID=UPI00315C8347
MDDESMLKLTTQSPILEPPIITSILDDKEPSIGLEGIKQVEDVVESEDKDKESEIKQEVVEKVDVDNDVQMEEVNESDNKNEIDNKEVEPEVKEEVKVKEEVVGDTIEDDDDPIVKLQEIEILPDLFTLIHNLKIGNISAKDFDNNAGSIRLKLSNIKQYLSEIDGINETLKARSIKIDNLKFNNGKKYQFLNKFKSKVLNEINNDIEMS